MTQSIQIPFEVETTISQEREEFIIGKLIEYNTAHSPLWEANHDGQFTAAPLHLFAVDTDGTVLGGLIGRTHSLRTWLEVVDLVVDEAWRGQGIGRALMKRAEEEGRKRGCRYARLSTSTSQAPGFYEKMGYVLYGKLENCPPGETALYYSKEL